MSRRALLWIVFAVVHVAVAALGFGLANQPMGDVYLVYEPWALRALGGHGVVGVTEEWVYPVLGLVPMLAAQAFAGIAGYAIGWALLVTMLDAVAFAILVGRARSRGRVTAAWYWLAFALLLGPVGMYRLDAVTVPLALVALLWLVRHPWIASALLAVAAWIKVWPAAMIVAAVVAMRARLQILAGALAVSAVIGVAVVAAGGGAHLFGFVTAQTGRGLQLEAPVSTVYLWQAIAGLEGSGIHYDRTILTFEVSGAGTDAVIALMTPVLAAAVLVVVVLGAVKALRGATFVRLFPPLAFALVLTLIVFNKVGSPQFLVWLIPPLALGLAIDRRRWRAPSLASLAAALLTFLVYPVLYTALISADAVAAATLTVRNAMLVAVLVWALVLLVRVPVRRASSPARALGADTVVRS